MQGEDKDQDEEDRQLVVTARRNQVGLQGIDARAGSLGSPSSASGRFF